MRTHHRPRRVRGRWLAVAAAAALAAAGLAAAVQAGIPDSSGVIHGCYTASNGQLRLISSGHACRRSERAISWNHTGPRGAAGSAGATGAPGSVGGTGPAGGPGGSGATGATGPAGASGSSGAAGTAGATGPAGATGTAGATGPSGGTGALGATGPRGPSDAYISEGPSTNVTTTLATIATLTLPATGTYLVWAKAGFNSASVSHNVACYLTTGSDGTLDGAFDASFGQIGANMEEMLPLQGELFVGPGNGTTVRLQCETIAGTVVGSASFQAIKVASVTLSP